MHELVMPLSFPDSDYTPHGYLNNPYHSMVLNRSGIIRSVPPLGFGFWKRSFKGSYGGAAGDHVNYLSLLHLAVAVDGVRLVDEADFARERIRLASRYHTQNMMSYDWMCSGQMFSLKYFLAREDSLVCRVEIRNTLAEDKELTLHATNIYGLWERRWWGSDGLAARYVENSDAGLSTIWAYGDYFALGSDTPSVAHKATASESQWCEWLRANDTTSNDGATVHGVGPLYTTQSYKITVPTNDSVAVLICLSRAPNEPFALEELQTGLRQALPTLEQYLDEDEAFWSACPSLVGDWPELWKRGWVYDYETLRMNVRRPLGVFRHPWDAMQIHSPRSVLAEAALDMFTLSYADADLAREVLFGMFADAPEANVPCMREDGGMNMIAADGSACGTAPSWCLPFHVIRAIHAFTGDVQWISAMYPYLKAYIEWWFEHRTNGNGGFHCHCDWESGQDGSKRFPGDEGAVADNVRTVDVEASMAEALRLMAHFSQIVDAPEDTPYWLKLAEQRTKATRAMFVDTWFHDIDTRTNTPIKLDYRDIMMLCPLSCQVATPEQVEALRPMFDFYRENPWPWLEWPSFFLVFAEAAWTARRQALLSEVIADTLDRVYARTDARQTQFVEQGKPYAWRVPGIANEYWPIKPEQEPSGEGYGWGATLPLHIIRGIVGFREPDALPATDETAAEFVLAPAIPERLMTVGKKYGLTNLRFGAHSLVVTYEVLEMGRLRVSLALELGEACSVEVSDDRQGVVFEESYDQPTGALAFDGLNGAVYTVRVTPAGI
ncbi:MAG: hypothetical protein JXO22_05265 [Phycisphaerae bacterium]|nr:hypothetical protein [Phycisphaerae bacterium]